MLLIKHANQLINLKLFKVDYKSCGVKNNLVYSLFGEDEKQVAIKYYSKEDLKIIQRKTNLTKSRKNV